MMGEDGDPPCTTCGDTGITYQTERRCACQGPMTTETNDTPPGLVRLDECPPGPFRFGDTYGFKTEYGAMETIGPTDVPGSDIRWIVGHGPDAYCMDSGEYFWGGAKTKAERAALLVEPIAFSAPARHLPSREEIVAVLAAIEQGHCDDPLLSKLDRREIDALIDAILSLLRGDTVNGGEG